MADIARKSKKKRKISVLIQMKMISCNSIQSMAVPTIFGINFCARILQKNGRKL